MGLYNNKHNYIGHHLVKHGRWNNGFTTVAGARIIILVMYPPLVLARDLYPLIL